MTSTLDLISNSPFRNEVTSLLLFGTTFEPGTVLGTAALTSVSTLNGAGDTTAAQQGLADLSSSSTLEGTADTTPGPIKVRLHNPTQIVAAAGSFVHLRNPAVARVEAPEGSYDPPPSHRMLWDVDGTRMRKYTPTTWSEYSSVEITDLNDEEGGTGVNDTEASAQRYVVYFPEKRDLAAVFASFAHANPADEVYVMLETSPDTTNGINGTWTTRVAETPLTGGPWGAAAVDYRAPVAVSAPGIRAIRFRVRSEVAASGWTLRSLHLYGVTSAGQNVHRLEVWHPTLDQRVAPDYFDWGRSPRGSSADRKFRIKNLSPSQRANSILVYVDALTDTFPSVAYSHYLSTGSVFANMLTINALEPGSISPVITLRRVTPSDAPLGVWAPRIRVTNGGWF